MSDFKNRCAIALREAGYFPVPEWGAPDSESYVFAIALVEWLDSGWYESDHVRKIFCVHMMLGEICKQIVVGCDLLTSLAPEDVKTGVRYLSLLNKPEPSFYERLDEKARKVVDAAADTLVYPFDTDPAVSKFQRLNEMALVTSVIGQVVSPWE